MKKITIVTAVVLVLMMLVSSASACTSIYVGANLTDDGAKIFGRSEDYSNSQNKLFFDVETGKYKTGDVYDGCYGFSWTFTHDSYAHTAFSDDNAFDGVCPDCGDDHAHTPYEAAGTNQMGLSMTATETLGCSDAAYEADPYEDLGIEEAEIVTVILSEAATAREGVELLAKIYDENGACGGSGIIIADDKEAWYIENVTGHQYIGVKLNADLLFMEPNMSVIGVIDLDDTENVIASEKLIATAQEGGFFVGDADANVIDYVASYNADQTANARMYDGIEYLTGAAADELAFADYCISNVDAEGNIVPMYTNIKAADTMTIDDVIDFYKVATIGTERSLENHIFQIYAEDNLLDTVEWVSMDDGSKNIFVPYYPMITSAIADSYKLGTACAEFVEEEPEEGLYYACSKRVWTEDGPAMAEGFMVFPENWRDSFYWCSDVMSNLLYYGGYDEETVAAAVAAIADEQAKVYADFDAMKAAVAACETAEEMVEVATDASMAMAEEVKAVTEGIIDGLLAK